MLFGEQIQAYLNANAEKLKSLIDGKDGIECYNANFYYVLEITTREEDQTYNKDELSFSIEGLFPRFDEEQGTYFSFECDKRALENLEKVAELLVSFLNSDFETLYNKNAGYSMNHSIEKKALELVYKPYKELFYIELIGVDPLSEYK